MAGHVEADEKCVQNFSRKTSCTRPPEILEMEHKIKLKKIKLSLCFK